MFEIFKKILPLAIGALIGYALYYFLFMEIIIIFIGSGTIFYPLISILCLIGCIIGCIIIINLIIHKNISKSLFIAIYILYFCVLLLILFGRHSIDRKFILNPLESIIALSDMQMLYQSIMNISAFMPMGFFFRKCSIFKTLFISFFMSILLELVQVTTMRGFFDTFDVILYSIGITIGTFIFKKFDISDFFNKK